MFIVQCVEFHGGILRYILYFEHICLPLPSLAYWLPSTLGPTPFTNHPSSIKVCVCVCMYMHMCMLKYRFYFKAKDRPQQYDILSLRPFRRVISFLLPSCLSIIRFIMGGSVMNAWFLMESSHYQVPGDSHITDHLAHPL